MTCKINADTSDGLKIVSDTSGVIDIQDNGTTRLTIGDTVDLQATELVLDADADTSIHASTDDQVDFKIGGTDRFSIAAAASTFSHDLIVSEANSDAATAVTIFNADGVSTVGNESKLHLGCTNSASHGGSIVAEFVGTADANHATDLIFNATNTGSTLAEKMRITNAGKVGIGIAAPNGQFAVSDATVTLEMNPTSSIGFIGTRTNHPVQFQQNAAARMTIDTAGRILCAQTAQFVNGSSAKFQVSYIKNSEFGIHIRPSDNDTGGGQPMLFQNQAGTSIGSVGANGSNVSFNTSSDYRLKENVNYSWDATSRLKQLKPARFNWIIDDTNTAIDGFMAHEVTSIVPDAVQGTKDGTKTRTKFIKDADGNFLFADVEEADWTAGKENGTYPEDSTWTASEDIPDYQSIDHSKLVPLLVKTVQELEARIKTLEDA